MPLHGSRGWSNRRLSLPTMVTSQPHMPLFSETILEAVHS
jgi:hypothetical protein